jgi:hypothetical protein
MKKGMVAIWFLSVLVAACGNKHHQGYAHITERKHLSSGQLRIHYWFNNEGKIYKDSAEVNNTVIPNDSVLIVFSSENPLENKLQIP